MADEKKEVQAGYEIQTVIKEINQEKINRYAEASGDFNPIHVNPEFAKETKFGGTIAHGLMSLAFISEIMTSWLGNGWVCGGEMDIKFTKPVRPGDTITARGKVLEKVFDAGKEMVVCEVFCENQTGDKVIMGTVKGYLV